MGCARISLRMAATSFAKQPASNIVRRLAPVEEMTADPLVCTTTRVESGLDSLVLLRARVRVFFFAGAVRA